MFSGRLERRLHVRFLRVRAYLPSLLATALQSARRVGSVRVTVGVCQLTISQLRQLGKTELLAASYLDCWLFCNIYRIVMSSNSRTHFSWSCSSNRVRKTEIYDQKWYSAHLYIEEIQRRCLEFALVENLRDCVHCRRHIAINASTSGGLVKA